MRAAASDLRREAPDAASERSQRALDRLQSVERGLREAGPDEQRRAAGDAQLEARQLADRQRQLADETAKAGAAASEDARRRLAGEQQRLAERADALNERVQRLAQGETGDRQARERLAEAARAAERGTHRPADARRLPKACGAGMRRPPKASSSEPSRASSTGSPTRSAARSHPAPIARAGSWPTTCRRRANFATAWRTSSGRSRRRASRPSRASQGESGKQGEPGKRAESGKPGESGEQGGRARRARGQRRLAELQREYLEQLRNAGELGERLEQASPGTGRAMSTPIEQQMVTSAPGTQAFKQDFSKWETLHKDIALGLERLEAALSQRVVERAARERLRTGATDRVPDTYRSTVDRYYRALAQEPR